MSNSAQIIETAYAKLNLALHVRMLRDDGYHAIETIFAFCDDGDRIAVTPADHLALTIDGPFADGLSTTDNLVVRAARALDPERGAAIHLTKNLPVASGIGGGSADAAATLRALSRLWEVPLPDASNFATLGADVPACLASTTCRASGIGDVMTPGDAVTGMPVLLVNSGVSVSTASVFNAWDGIDRGPLGDWQSGRNDLTAAALSVAPEIAVVLETLKNLAGNARMSGSGATCFAVFESVAARDVAADRFAEYRPDWWQMRSILR